MLENKVIVVGICGGIAAFKSAALVSQLTQAGAEVHVMMTESATKFVTPLTFQAVSRNHVYIDTFDEPDAGKITHIDLADRADLIFLAPASANTIAKLAHGMADNMLTTTVLATKAPVVLAPAMNVNMFDHPSVQANLARLVTYGYEVIEPDAGFLACGWTGKGRMPEVPQLLEYIQMHATPNTALANKRVVVTAGPTREAIDPVRYLSNDSSGKMGYALAREARNRGAHVTLISGPTVEAIPVGVEVVSVKTSADMYEAVLARYDDADVVVKSAAVSDYRPMHVYEQKRKKKADDDWTLALAPTADILRTLGEEKHAQLLVGFAAESEQVERHAREKLARKNLDIIVANDITAEGAGFDVDTNIVSIYTKDDHCHHYEKQTKAEVARHVFDEVEAYEKRCARP
ncbi:bifunctional phosphopantothenoylcysteine decarboxylase/phosphopantothenate--cysteine ligase CoaBC [Shouchella lonarensis]|uniref:Coenzyme A biosynthesis bifunctional protein CoaBC n=1 Tax=Shouchella lonarensis TaxID=1464122 RepID=A0A1G6L8K8_9BACI|nr:bifunctional phosphopantothenoylcysteine decarboxylase/phosphopantothenate--cysteine ligase CoaBC [Shouchella lonarensis]SDC39604.1 Phosphopantothenate-cysteine ligase /Phosphopantothenoylcysteine decarboxylase [Shouchella lonarensis]